MNELLDKTRVKGMGQFTARYVLDYLRKSDCDVYLYGGFVRDLFLGRTPVGIEVEVTCKSVTVHKACVQKFGKQNCHRGGHSVVTIGEHAHLPVKEVRLTKTLFQPSHIYTS